MCVNVPPRPGSFESVKSDLSEQPNRKIKMIDSIFILINFTIIFTGYRINSNYLLLKYPSLNNKSI